MNPDGRGNSTYNGPDLSNGPGAPYSLTIAGVPLNWPVPEVWNGMTPTGSLS